MSENSRISDPNWSPNALRYSSFPDCHWQLCRQFMDRHQNLLPQEQLCALGHIFANTQLLLRGEPDQTMQLVLDLVKDLLPVETLATVEVDHVEKSRWEREAEPELLESGPVVEMEALNIATAGVDNSKEIDQTFEDDSNCKTDSILSEELEDSQPAPDAVTKFIRDVPAVEPISMESVYNNLILIGGDFGKTQSSFNRLNCGRLEMTVEKKTATIKIDQLVLAKATAKKRRAQVKVVKVFFANMRDHCYRIETIMSQKQLIHSATNFVPRETVQPQQANCPDPINETNLGWTGGPLGASAQGRLDPVECSALRKGRAGIGAVQEDAIDPAHYRQVMTDFQAKNEVRPLVFSAEFTNQECAELKRIAAQLRLDGRVFDLPQGGKRFAVMARELPPHKIVRRVLIEKDAILSAQYRVVPPKRCASFFQANPTPEDCIKIPKPVSQDKNESSESDNDSQSSSDEEVSAGEASSTDPVHLSQKPVKKSVLDRAFYSKILDGLTQFKPISPLRSIEDVFHNIVLIGYTIAKTKKEFKKVGSGTLKFTNFAEGGGFCARISVGEFVLTEVCDRNRKVAKKGAEEAFFKKAGMFCYRLMHKNASKDLRNVIARDQNPETNIEYYRDIIEHFAKNSVEEDLFFSQKFTSAERKMLQSIAYGFKLRVVTQGPSRGRFLRIKGHRLPALAIVERIVVHQDPWLSARYEVNPPRMGARVW